MHKVNHSNLLDVIWLLSRVILWKTIGTYKPHGCNLWDSELHPNIRIKVKQNDNSRLIAYAPPNNVEVVQMLAMKLLFVMSHILFCMHRRQGSLLITTSKEINSQQSLMTSICPFIHFNSTRPSPSFKGPKNHHEIKFCAAVHKSIIPEFV